MSEATRIAGLFRAAFNGDDYGRSLLTVLERVTSDVAADRPSFAHSIWELVVHITAEMNYARDVLDGHVRPMDGGRDNMAASHGYPLRQPGRGRLTISTFPIGNW
jgi:hypothetical protein